MKTWGKTQVLRSTLIPPWLQNKCNPLIFHTNFPPTLIGLLSVVVLRTYLMSISIVIFCHSHNCNQQLVLTGWFRTIMSLKCSAKSYLNKNKIYRIGIWFYDIHTSSNLSKISTYIYVACILHLKWYIWQMG